MKNAAPLPSEILLVGGGGHCRSLLDVLSTLPIRATGIVDNDAGLQRVLDIPVIGTDADLERLHSQYAAAVVAVGQIKSSAVRCQLFNRLRDIGYVLPIICSTLAHISTWAKLDIGTAVMHYAVINAGARIGENCIINTRAIIEHDVTIGAHCHISTGAILNGGVSVGDGVFIGSGALIREGVRIGEGCVIGMGATIRHDVPARTVIKEKA